MLAMSMFPPHLAAPGFVAVWEAVREAYADISELLAARLCIIPDTDVGEANALGGLIIPNIPFGQWPGVLQKKKVGLVSFTTCVKTKPLLLVPDVKKRESMDLLQGVSWEPLVTVWLLAPHMNLMVSPTEAFTAKGT